ncbi:MAG: beta strand repeat-containing protein [Acutalibacteraceae bacterium]
MKKIKRTALAFLLVLAVTAALVPSVCLSAFAAVWTGGTAVPTMNAQGYYLIDTPEKLAWFSERVNSGYNSINAKQTADLDLGGLSFTPIGTAAYPFLGVYDGGGCTVANLKVTGDAENRGLFGVIGTTKTTETLTDEWGDTYTESTYTPSQVNNIVLTDCDVSGTKYVGGVVGYSDGGSITGCSVSGTVQNTGSGTGGIVGYQKAGATVLNCLNSAAVSGELRVGGIAGYCYSNTEVRGCCNVGTVTGQNFVGGIVGLSSGSDVSHSYNKGSISATENTCGGLVGYAMYGDIYCMYTIGTVSCAGEYTGIAFGNVLYGTMMAKCYYDRDNTDMTDLFATPAEHALMMDETFLTTLNFNYDIFVGDYFQTNNGYPILRWQLVAWDGSVGEPETDANGVYLLTNGSELAWFAALVNGTLSDTAQNTAANARVTKDILLNPAIFDETANIWTPIGTEDSPFTGSFDGGEYRISGIYISDTEKNMSGLFGMIGAGGTVKNIFIETSKIYGYSHIGMIAGQNNGTIQNCFNYGTLQATYYSGGIAGVNEGTIQNCGNIGEELGSNYSGGITGSNNSTGVVNSCFNMGYVTGVQRTGGIIGNNNGKIQCCYNAGTVNGGASVGGLVGYQNSSVSGGFTACYNMGRVSGLSNSKGAVVGYNLNGNVTYCYYDSERSNATDSVATAKTTAEMAEPTSVSAFSGFSTTYWVDRTPDQYFDYCPELRVFYNSTNTLLKNTSKESAAVLKPSYVVMAEVDGEMHTYYDSLQAGSSHIGTGTGTLSVLRDHAITQTMTAQGTVTVTDNGETHTVKRGDSFSGSFFSVEGALTVQGTGENTLVLDGGVTSSQTGDALVFVNVDSTLTLEDGVLLQNNTSEDNGGGLYIDGGTVVMNGGTITGNTALRGGGIYNHAGFLTANGGTVSGNTASVNGGGIFSDGKYSETNLAGLTVSGNTAGNGGGICSVGSPVSMTGGTLSDNTATTGGGIYTNGTFHLAGGTITGNIAVTGSGIYDNGTLEMADNAFVAQNNDVYLVSGKTVVNTAQITTDGLVAYLTVADYAVGTRVLSGDFCASNYAKFVLNVPLNETELNINSTGYLVDKEISNVAKVSVFGAYDVFYTSLKEAVDSIGEGTGLVCMVGDDSIGETIEVRGNVTIIGDEIGGRTLSRYRTCTGNMFTVAEGATLQFGTAGSADNTALYVDGGSKLYGTYGESMISNSGTVKLYDGATLCNASTLQNGGVVCGTGSVEICGGSITDCSAANGGAVCMTGGTLQMTDGTVTNCSASENGGAVYVLGAEATMQSGTISGCTAENGGAIYAGDEAVLSLQGGTLSGNEAVYGGAVLADSAEFTMPGGTLTVVITDENGDISYTEVDVTATVSANHAENGGGIYLRSGSGDFSAGSIENNTADVGAALYIEPDAAFTIRDDASVSGNTAVHGSSSIYDNGTLTIRSAVVSASDTVYLVNGKTIVPEGTQAGATIAPSSYAIGTQILTGDSVAALYSGFTIANTRFFVAADGKLDTDTLSLKESSHMVVDYDNGIITGIDVTRNTTAQMREEFDNAGASLSFTAADGTALADDASLTTGCLILLSDGTGKVLDSKTFVMVGDVDGDGDFDAEDSVYISAIAGGYLTDSQSTAAMRRASDANNDGTVDATDAALLRACGMLRATVTQP